MERGKYIVIEGGEGAGKTTQAKLLQDYLNKLNVPCQFGREPGGIPSAEKMREILKNPEYKISSIGEVFGFNFARAEFFNQIIIPTLNKGIHFITDRSGYSTEAIQGYGGKVPLEQIRQINKIAMQEISPALGLIIDIDPAIGLKKEIVTCRISAKGLEYHQRVRQGFLEIAKREKSCVIIPYQENNPEAMQKEIREHVKKLLNL